MKIAVLFFFFYGACLSTQSSLSSPDFFDSPSPEDEKEEHVSITHKTLEVSRKSRTVTISQVS